MKNYNMNNKKLIKLKFNGRKLLITIQLDQIY